MTKMYEWKIGFKTLRNIFGWMKQVSGTDINSLRESNTWFLDAYKERYDLFNYWCLFPNIIITNKQTNIQCTKNDQILWKICMSP